MYVSQYFVPEYIAKNLDTSDNISDACTVIFMCGDQNTTFLMHLQ